MGSLILFSTRTTTLGWAGGLPSADTGGPANIGDGKSPGMKCFVNTMVDVLSANMRHAVGYPSDRFHFQQSGTSASAIDKLLNCDGFPRDLLPRCNAVSLSSSGDAAHGDEFSHTTQRMRQKAATEVLVNPARPVANKPKLRVDPTNVHVLLLQQEVLSANWWPQVIPKKPVGLAQRFLFAFGGDADPAGSVYSHCASRGATRHAGY